MQQPIHLLVPRRHLFGLFAGLLVLIVHAAAAPLAVQKRNDPASCPYCKNDPSDEEGGLVSRRLRVRINDGAGRRAVGGQRSVGWVEHFQLGFALSSHKLRTKRRSGPRRARQALWVCRRRSRSKCSTPGCACTYAQHYRVYARFREIMQVKTAIPKGGTPWNGQGKYMGEGPYLGQNGKYEVLLLPSEAAGTQFLREQFGLLTKLSQRWNVVHRDSLVLVVHTGQGDLKEDGAMHGHVAFNLAINLLDGYKHYSYETPIWIREGLDTSSSARSTPSSTPSTRPGAVAAMTRREKWEPEVRKMVSSGPEIRMAELMALKDYAGLTLNYHYTTWSMTDYLVRTKPDAYAALNARLHGITNKQHIGDGSNMPDVHRTAFQECIGMNYSEFDAAWAKWVEDTYVTTFLIHHPLHVAGRRYPARYDV
jgi:hypothetical protein